MDSLENSEEIFSDEFPTIEGHIEAPESESLETSEPEFQEEIMDLIFPEDRPIYVTIYAYVLNDNGRPVIKMVTDRVTPELTGAGLTEYKICSSWTVPTAAQMDVYREECSEYNRDYQGMLCNNLMIRDTIVANHLKELLFPPSYSPYLLKYTRPNRLSGETVGRIKKMHSGIYDRLYTEFISESCLIV